MAITIVKPEDLKDYENRIQLPACPSDRTHSFMLYGLVLRNENKYRMP